MCTRGKVRLEGGATSAQGTVGACFRNQWGAVCDSYWTDADAKVVCGQLCYTGKEAWCHPNSDFHHSYPQVVTPCWGPTMGQGLHHHLEYCRGNESIISACKYTDPVLSCYSANYAGVSCYSKL